MLSRAYSNKNSLTSDQLNEKLEGLIELLKTGYSPSLPKEDFNFLSSLPNGALNSQISSLIHDADSLPDAYKEDMLKDVAALSILIPIRDIANPRRMSPFYRYQNALMSVLKVMGFCPYTSEKGGGFINAQRLPLFSYMGSGSPNIAVLPAGLFERTREKLPKSEKQLLAQARRIKLIDMASNSSLSIIVKSATLQKDGSVRIEFRKK